MPVIPCQDHQLHVIARSLIHVQSHLINEYQIVSYRSKHHQYIHIQQKVLSQSGQNHVLLHLLTLTNPINWLVISAEYHTQFIWLSPNFEWNIQSTLQWSLIEVYDDCSISLNYENDCNWTWPSTTSISQVQHRRTLFQQLPAICLLQNNPTLLLFIRRVGVLIIQEPPRYQLRKIHQEHHDQLHLINHTHQQHQAILWKSRLVHGNFIRNPRSLAPRQPYLQLLHHPHETHQNPHQNHQTQIVICEIWSLHLLHWIPLKILTLQKLPPPTLRHPRTSFWQFQVYSWRLSQPQFRKNKQPNLIFSLENPHQNLCQIHGLRNPKLSPHLHELIA